MKILITGITGFVGSHLAEYALSQNAEIFGSIRWRSKRDNINHLEGQLKLVDCDLRDLSSAQNLIDQTRPDYIFHLAAQSFVLSSWHAPADTLINNISCQLNLFEATRKASLAVPILIALSSEEYGLVKEEELPIKEDNPLRPLSPYAVSKVAQDFLGYQYHKSYGLKIIRTRSFNHTGPRRGEVFASSNFAKQVAEIEKGKKPPIIYVGNLEAKRDFTDVSDIVRAYWLGLFKCVPGEVYNICSGKALSIRGILEILMGHSSVKPEIQQDPSRMRPSDVPILRGDNSKFNRVTGWVPEIPIEKTLLDLLNYWRERV